MRNSLAILFLLLLSGCVANPSRDMDAAHHDLGEPPAGAGASIVPIADLGVRAASWLDTPAQSYRLVYADHLRRHAYTASRWVAPPAELLESFLRRVVVFGQADGGGPGCRLDFALDELEQRFDSPQSSAIVLEMRAALLPPRGKTALAKRAFLIRKPAPTPDAQGGAQATRAAAQALAGELARWLDSLSRERPQAISSCKEAS